MKSLTVFTPTYNRAYCLNNAFLALKRQTVKDFKWLIIDDGSTDSTCNVVKLWQDECHTFDIIYIYKENGGLHTAYNLAIEQLDTELAICVDSDDFLPDDAVEEILKLWSEKGSTVFAGIVGLDYTLQGKRLGGLLPEQESINLIDLFIGKYKVKQGDRKLIVRSDLYKSVASMKIFAGEKNFNPEYMHLRISEKYDFLVTNRNLCYVEYQKDGMTRNMLWQYYNSPKSFMETRKLYLSFPNTPIIFQFRHTVHYISSCILAKKKECIPEVSSILLRFFAYPLGYLLTLIIIFKNKRKNGK